MPHLPDDRSYLARRKFEACIDQAEASITKIERSIRGAFHLTFRWHIDARSHRNRRMTIDGTTKIDRVATYIHQ